MPLRCRLLYTALAHLWAAILYVINLFEQCKQTHSGEAASADESIKPLFTNKPLIVALNKTDIVGPEEVAPDVQEELKKLQSEGVTVIPVSTVTKKGVLKVKVEVCELLLVQCA